MACVWNLGDYIFNRPEILKSFWSQPLLLRAFDLGGLELLILSDSRIFKHSTQAHILLAYKLMMMTSSHTIQPLG